MDGFTRLRDAFDAHLTATEFLAAVRLTPMRHPLDLHVLVPAASEVNDKLDVSIIFRNSSAVTIETVSAPQYSADVVGKIVLPFFCDLPNLYDFVITLTCTDADAGTDFDCGLVEAWISPSPSIA
jgi:hypothetical protein